MKANIKNVVPMKDANQDFSKVAQMVEKSGTTIITKDNVPSYVIMKYEEFDKNTVETLDKGAVADGIIERHFPAFKELAK